MRRLECPPTRNDVILVSLCYETGSSQLVPVPFDFQIQFPEFLWMFTCRKNLHIWTCLKAIYRCLLHYNLLDYFSYIREINFKALIRNRSWKMRVKLDIWLINWLGKFERLHELQGRSSARFLYFLWFLVWFVGRSNFLLYNEWCIYSKVSSNCQKRLLKP